MAGMPFYSDPYFYVTLYVGLCLGSFATALSWRLPQGISIWKKARSSCPACGHDLSWRDLVPLLSWLLQRGRCRYCREKIDARYPVVEEATAFFCLAAYFIYGFTPAGIVIAMLAPALVGMGDIDLRHKILPDSLNAAVFLLGALMLLVQCREDTAQFIDAAQNAGGGMLLYGGGAWLLRFTAMRMMKREPMGLGDVKFFAAAGFWLGADVMIFGIFMFLSGAAGVALSLWWKHKTDETVFPFGPALVAAFTIIIFMASFPVLCQA